jgi:hypothetical protein
VTWTAQAEVLADTEEIGDDIALMAGRCRITGLDPRSFAPIMGAAMVLGSRPWHVMESPYDSDEELIGEVLDHDNAVWRRQNAYLKLRSAIVQTRAHAIVMYNHAAAQDPPITMDMDYYRAVRVDCDTALEVLAPLPGRLRTARARLMRAPAELGETYEAVYALLSQGRVMPHDGRFITGEESHADHHGHVRP